MKYDLMRLKPDCDVPVPDITRHLVAEKGLDISAAQGWVTVRGVDKLAGKFADLTFPVSNVQWCTVKA